jgi:uncharacterized protein YeaO (DUF488 family)
MTVPVPAKRIDDDVEPDDRYRVLTDRIWPRGISGERAKLEERARKLTLRRDLQVGAEWVS